MEDLSGTRAVIVTVTTWGFEACARAIVLDSIWASDEALSMTIICERYKTGDAQLRSDGIIILLLLVVAVLHNLWHKRMQLTLCGELKWPLVHAQYYWWLELII